jgi:hypothetical protein
MWLAQRIWIWEEWKGSAYRVDGGEDADGGGRDAVEVGGEFDYRKANANISNE